MSQSYRRAVVKNPPKGDYFLQVFPPTKQGSGWHYGGCVRPTDSELSSQPNRSYTIWRKWEDCLELQRTVEREFSYLSARRRKQLGHDKADGMYQQGGNGAASFESLPCGPEPLSLALNVHTHLPKLSKKNTLFGRPSASVLSQRASDFEAFIDAMFTLHTPLMDDVLQQRAVRDWFGYWRRDKDGEMKAAAALSTHTSGAPSPASQDGSLTLAASPSATPTREIDEPLMRSPPMQRLSTTSTSSESGSSLGNEPKRSSRSEFGDDDADDELLDSFPLTPAVGPTSVILNPVIHSSDGSQIPDAQRIHETDPTETQTAALPSAQHSKTFTSSFPHVGFSIGGIMAPAPIFRSRSGPATQKRAPSLSRSTKATSTATSPTDSTTPTISSFNPRPKVPMPDKLVIPELPPVVRTPRPRPGAAGGLAPWSAGQRQGRIFVAEPKRPQSAGGVASRSGNVAAASASPPQEAVAEPWAEERLSVSPLPDRPRAHSAVETTGAAVPHQNRSTLVRSSSISGRRRSTTSPYSRPPSTSSACPTIVPTTAFNDIAAPPASSNSRYALAPGFCNIPEHTHGHNREISDVSTVGSLIDVTMLPWLPSNRNDDREQMPPAVSGRKRSSQQSHAAIAWGRSSRVTRHSISSIESYMSDSSIDAALSTMRLGQSINSHQTSESASVTGSSGSRHSMESPSQKNVEEDEEGFQALDPEMASHLSFKTRSSLNATLADHHSDIKQARSALADEEDFDVIDSYYYSPPSSFTHSGASGQPIPPSPSLHSPSPSKASHHSARAHSITSFAGIPDDYFVVKILYPSSTDCGAVVLRIPRATSFESFQDKLHAKFHDAEGVDLSMLQKGFKLGSRLPPPTADWASVLSNGSDVSLVGTHDRMRSFSIDSRGSGSMVDPSHLAVIKNQEDWERVVPSGKEKLILQIFVAN
ncbi:hypothetical protein FRB94_010413 [Tulasnella sp. JGI-2019a]|nr:hypothetical protein FRB94_010413 [Tulasnella sp. JGI-2019a]